MIKAIHLLDEKNNYLEKFIGLNTLKLQKLAKGDFNDLEEFREERENILNIIKHIDSMIDSRAKNLDPQMIPREAKIKIQALMALKDDFVHTILSQDLEIMQIIEEAKSQIILELQTVRKSKKTIGSYKSGTKKETLDEEF